MDGDSDGVRAEGEASELVEAVDVTVGSDLDLEDVLDGETVAESEISRVPLRVTDAVALRVPTVFVADLSRETLSEYVMEGDAESVRLSEAVPDRSSCDSVSE